MTRRHRLIRSCSAAAALWLPALAGAQTPGTAPASSPHPAYALIDSSLRAVPIRLVSFAGITLSYLDETGAARTMTTDEIVAIAPLSWLGLDAPLPVPTSLQDEAPATVEDSPEEEVDLDPRQPRQPPKPLPPPRISQWILELADHQRFPGHAAAAQPDTADSFAWEHPLLGRLVFSIDSAAALWSHKSARPAPAPAGDDSVLLANGDTLRGLVESIGDVIKISPAGAHRPLELPWDRVTAMTIASEPALPDGPMLWLTDSTACRFNTLSLQPEGLAIEIPRAEPGSAPAAMHSVSIDPANFAAILIDTDQTSALAMAALTSQKSADDSRPRQARLGDSAAPLLAAPIELPGPMTVQWSLPVGTTRLAGWARLPDDCLDWGDCVLTVSIAQAGQAGVANVLATHRLNAESPRVRLDCDLGPPSAAPRLLTITLDQGERGPIQDRVILEHVLIRTAEPRR
ncbi:MAG: hypothetical protein H7Y88_05090 [Phycisphaerales bacterium]|nr:hypothetical protein [Phycisphaerales bacterium]